MQMHQHGTHMLFPGSYIPFGLDSRLSSDTCTEPLVRKKKKKKASMRNPMVLQVTAAAVVVTVTMLLASSPAAVQGIVTDEDCKCFMCVCDLDPHPLPPEVPTTHHAPPVVAASPPPPSPPPPATVVVVPATYYPPPSGVGYYYPPQPYGYPWPTTASSYGYGPPAGEMYPRETKSGASLRHGGSGLVLAAVALASAVLLALLPF